MKLTIFLLACGSLFNSLIGQEHPIDSFFPLNENKKVEYDSVYVIENATKDNIYNSIQEFVDKYYNISLEQSSRVNDRESGLISFKYIDKKIGCAIEAIRYKVTIKIKDNKYKLNFSNFEIIAKKDKCFIVSLEEPKNRRNLVCGWYCTFAPQKDWENMRLKVSESVNTHFLEIKSSILNNFKNKDNW